MTNSRSVIIFVVLINSTVALKELTLQGFLPMTGEGWVGGGACLPATLMALRHVNEMVGMLEGYNLTYTWVDTQVSYFIFFIAKIWVSRMLRFFV